MGREISEYIRCQFCHVETRHIVGNFRRCPRCTNLYNGDYRTTVYEDTYFESEYKNQYGKSYIGDKANIQKKMRSRLEILKTCAGSFQGKNLLEVGSAAGFFLELANGAGLKSQGWELSAYMCDYANKHGLTTRQGNLLELLDKAPSNSFDMIAAFYVIEHFTEQKKIWEGFSRLLKNGGVLALALPSFYGPAYHFHRSDWVRTHPRDHFLDYSPGGIKKVCKVFGLKILHISPEGLHPERFFLGNLPFLKNVYTTIQKTCKFSDTMFVVLQK